MAARSFPAGVNSAMAAEGTVEVFMVIVQAERKTVSKMALAILVMPAPLEVDSLSF
jgi:hypothetical protein